MYYAIKQPVMSSFIEYGIRASLALYNVNGKLVYAKEAHWSELQLLDVDLKSGIYLVRVSDEGRVFTAKLVVQ
jgi:hypothetical protein